jgi:hypothetical protein
LSIPEVRGLEKDLRKAARCEGGIAPKRWVFRNSKIPERLSSLETRVAELGGAGYSSSLCSIDADKRLYSALGDRQGLSKGGLDKVGGDVSSERRKVFR